MYRYFVLLLCAACACAFNCHAILQDKEIMYLSWQNLQRCLAEVSGQILTKEINENIWRLVTKAFTDVQHIPEEVFSKLGYVLTVIPLADLHNISMTSVESVAAFGSISLLFEETGFQTEQLEVIAVKVRNEWLGKHPQTYSAYDLMSMGEIVCYFKPNDIQKIHADALKDAVETLGNVKNCPHNGLVALAQLLTSDIAFGEPRKWSKLEVSIVGNIINGLSDADLATIDKDKLHLNHFYQEKRNNKNC